MDSGPSKNEASKTSDTRNPLLLDEIPPFRVQSIDFKTVEVVATEPHVRVKSIENLDVAIDLPDHQDLFVLVTQQCFSEKILVEGGSTKRNVIRSTRIAFRKIYQEARVLGVRSELDNLRTLIVYSFRIEFDKDCLILIPEVCGDD